MIKRSLLSALLCIFLFSAIPVFADQVIGLPADSGTGNCLPFGCPSYQGEYQQVYNSGAFSAPITIIGLQFFNTQYSSNFTALSPRTWTISLSTASVSVSTISSTFSSNIGADNTQVFSGDLAQPWTFGNTLNISLSTPFTYNPANGNLLLDVLVSGYQYAGAIYFDTNGVDSYYSGSGEGIVSRVYGYGTASNGIVNNGYGLVTGFIAEDVSAVPEPTSLILLGSGIGVLGLAAWRKRK